MKNMVKVCRNKLMGIFIKVFTIILIFYILGSFIDGFREG
jgi:hypothetical protein